MQTTLATTMLALLTTLASSAAQEPEAAKAALAFPRPTEGISIRSGGEGMNHLQLARVFSDVTGLNLVLSSEAAHELEGRPVQLLGDFEIPPSQVYPVVESMLLEAGFYLSEIGNGAPHVYMLRSIEASRRVTPKNNARFVDADHIQAYRDHPAVIVQTVLHLEMDARQLTNSLRSLLTDANTQAAIPVGMTNSIVLVGYGRDVAELADLLLDADAVHRARMEEEAEARASEEASAEDDDDDDDD